MKKSIIMIASIFVFLTMAVASSSFASCNQYGKVFYVYQTTSYSYFYITPRTTLPTYSYYYYVSDPELISTLSSAMSAGTTVYISGSATTCPTSGTYRYSGVTSSARVYRNY